MKNRFARMILYDQAKTGVLGSSSTVK